MTQKQFIIVLLTVFWLLAGMSAAQEAPSKRIKVPANPRKPIPIENQTEQSSQAEKIWKEADSLILAGDTTNAINSLLTLIRTAPDDSLAKKAIWFIGEYKLSHNDFDGLMRILNGYPSKSAETEFLRARVLEMSGKYGAALKKYREIEVIFAGTRWENMAAKAALRVARNL